jgi:predicted permease
LLAWWCTSALAALGPKEIPRVNEARIDMTVMLFSLAASLLTGLLFGLTPALRASRIDLNDALKDLSKATAGRGQHRLRNLLVIAEMAIAFVLVAGAALLGKSFLHLLNVDPGYDPHKVLALSSYLYGARYQKPEAELAYFNQVMQGLRTTPGIEGVAMSSELPMADFDRRGFHIRDRRPKIESDVPSADAYSVSPDYFRVMKIALRSGRVFNDADSGTAPKVAVISETCARQQFPGGKAIGQQIQLGGRDEKAPWITIVGIVGDVHQYGLEIKPDIAVYIAQAQDLSFSYSFVVRTNADPRQMERTVRAAFLAVDPTLPLFRVQPMESFMASTLAQRRFTLELIALFGALALGLAGVGIYGVIAYAVTLRTREIGIRMALGAERRNVLLMTLRTGAVLTAAGLAIGFLASLALTRLLASLLFEVRATDWTTSLSVAVVLVAVALLASYLPARRAASVDPMIALRYE